jgi:hypothetical protein
MLLDLNLPLAAELHQQFDAVIDGGTLEHVFNFPIAIKTVMELTKVGGRAYLFTPANNHMGHGFYQFSPELLYRVFAPANGFEVERMVAKEMGSSSYFQVSDPDALRHRVALVNRRPLLLMVQAKRISAVPIFATPPQQSDYVHTWGGNTEAAWGKKTPTRDALRDLTNKLLPPKARLVLRRFLWEPIRGPLRHRKLSLSNREHYKPVSL